MTGREKEIVRHLSEDDLDRLLTQTDSEKVSKRLTFVKRLNKGATLEDAADDVGMSHSDYFESLLPWRSVSMIGVVETAPSDTVDETIRLNQYQSPRETVSQFVCSA